VEGIVTKRRKRREQMERNNEDENEKKRIINTSTDVSGQPIGFHLQGSKFFLDCLTLESGTDTLSRNVGNQIPTYAV
jgi:hypothetical protein